MLDIAEQQVVPSSIRSCAAAEQERITVCTVVRVRVRVQTFREHCSYSYASEKAAAYRTSEYCTVLYRYEYCRKTRQHPGHPARTPQYSYEYSYSRQ